MDLKRLKDGELLNNLKQFVQSERQLLTKILHHLKEVERRKLFSELGYRSLFEYAIKELKYSEGQAGRRIQAMRLLKEIPSVEEKIASGHLSLSNVSQAQSYFRAMNKCLPQHKMPLKDKIEVLKNLEGKSAREGQKVLLKMQPQEVTLPKERKRIVTESHTQVSFIMTSELEAKIEELRSLLGSKGATMNLAELVEHMVEVSLKEAKIKKFGKKRVTNSEKTPTSELENQSLSLSDKLAINNLEKSVPYKTAETKNSDITISEKTPTSELENHCLSLSDELAINNLEKFVPYKTAKTKDSDKKDRIENKDRVDSKDQDKSELDDNDLDDNELDDNELDSKNLDKKYQDRKVQEKRNHKRRELESRNLTKKNNQIKSQNPRYISKKLKYHIWQRDSGKCTKCGSRQHLNVDHVKPVALGGEANSENLRLLCQPCNQRQAIRIFGLNHVENQIKKE